MEAVEVAKKNLIKKMSLEKKKEFRAVHDFGSVFTSCVTLGKLLILQEPPVPHLQNGTSYTCLTEPLGGLYKATPTQQYSKVPFPNFPSCRLQV